MQSNSQTGAFLGAVRINATVQTPVLEKLGFYISWIGNAANVKGLEGCAFTLRLAHTQRAQALALLLKKTKAKSQGRAEQLWDLIELLDHSKS